jgi:hypothetical protein
MPAYLQHISIFRNTAGVFSAAYWFPEMPNASYRGGATADFNNDGRMDLIVLPIDGNPVLLENSTSSKNAWVGFALRGTRSNRDAIGARISVQACGVSQFDTVRNGGSYLSRNDPRIHFGLGHCSAMDRVTIVWPRGTVQVLEKAPLNRYNAVVEP